MSLPHELTDRANYPLILRFYLPVGSLTYIDGGDGIPGKAMDARALAHGTALSLNLPYSEKAEVVWIELESMKQATHFRLTTGDLLHGATRPQVMIRSRIGGPYFTA